MSRGPITPDGGGFGRIYRRVCGFKSRRVHQIIQPLPRRRHQAALRGAAEKAKHGLSGYIEREGKQMLRYVMYIVNMLRILALEGAEDGEED